MRIFGLLQEFVLYFTGIIKIPAVVQIAVLKIIRCAVGAQILPDLGVPKIALRKTISTCDGVISHLHA